MLYKPKHMSEELFYIQLMMELASNKKIEIGFKIKLLLKTRLILGL
jgi:hypothetical protein